jgi:hypothetical protein
MVGEKISQRQAKEARNKKRRRRMTGMEIKEQIKRQDKRGTEARVMKQEGIILG